jgi:hypothetical protein
MTTNKQELYTTTRSTVYPYRLFSQIVRILRRFATANDWQFSDRNRVLEYSNRLRLPRWYRRESTPICSIILLTICAFDNAIPYGRFVLFCVEWLQLQPDVVDICVDQIYQIDDDQIKHSFIP